MIRRLLATIGIIVAAVSAASAVPTVSSVTWSGTLNYGRTVVVTGTTFGTKPNQSQTYFFANGEDASAGVAGSTFGYVSTMGDIVNVSRVTSNCWEGSGCFGRGATTMDLQDNNTARVTFDDVGAGGKFFQSFVWRLYGTEPSDTGNWKTYRIWPSSVGTKNNLYGGQQTDGSFNNATENTNGLAITNFDRKFTTDVQPNIGVDQQADFYFQLNSDATTSSTDGIRKIDIDGTNYMNMTTWRSNTSLDTGSGRYRNSYLIHMVWTGSGGFSADNDFRYDNLIFETSWCVVWLSTSPTNVASAKKYFMPVQTWSDTQITYVLAQNLIGGTSYYQYVMSNDGTQNATGKGPILVSASGAANTAPAVDAGTDKLNSSSATFTLNGSGTDDGLPTPPNTVTYAWAKVSGPGSVTFGDSASAATTANFSAAGSYALSLTANDSALSTVDYATMTVIVASPTPTGISPSVGLRFGGFPFTLNGTDFASGASVFFGTVPASGVVFVNSTQLTGVVPNSLPGTVTVTVTNPGNASSASGPSFTYDAPAPIAIGTQGRGLVYMRTGGLNRRNRFEGSVVSTAIVSGDVTAPAAVSDFAALNNGTTGQLSLSWHATGDDGTTGTIAPGTFRIIYSTSAAEINAAFATSSIVTPLAKVDIATTGVVNGSTHSYTLGGLSSGTQYFARVFTADEVPNWSAVSNGSTATTTSPDVTPPAAVTDIAALANGTTYQLNLSWTAPGDDGVTGNLNPGTFRLFYSAVSGDMTGLTAATPANGTLNLVDVATTSVVPGSKRFYQVGGLSAGVTYYVRVFSADEANNFATISNGATAFTQALSGGSFADILFYSNCDSVTSGQAPQKGVGTITVGASWTSSTTAVVGNSWANNNTGNAGGRISFSTSTTPANLNIDMAKGRIGFYFYPLESGASSDGDPLYGNGATTAPKWFWQNVSGTNSWSYKDKQIASFSLTANTWQFVEFAWDSAETTLGAPCKVIVDGVTSGTCSAGSTGLDPAPSSIRLGGIDGNGFNALYDQIIISNDPLRDLNAVKNTTSFP